MTENKYEGAECRHCGVKLIGKPYSMGGNAYLPPERGSWQARVNHYGGFVCSERCDYEAALSLEQSMPGHGMRQKTLNPRLAAKIRANWENVK